MLERLQRRLGEGHRILHRYPNCLVRSIGVPLLGFLQPFVANGAWRLGKFEASRMISGIFCRFPSSIIWSLILFMRSISVVFVVKFCVVTNVLHDEGNAPNRSSLCSFGSISLPEVRQSSNLRFQFSCTGSSGRRREPEPCFVWMKKEILWSDRKDPARMPKQMHHRMPKRKGISLVNRMERRDVQNQDRSPKGNESLFHTLTKKENMPDLMDWVHEMHRDTDAHPGKTLDAKHVEMHALNTTSI